MAATPRPAILIVVLAVAGLLSASPGRAQVDPAVRDRVVPASVQIAMRVTVREGAVVTDYPLPLGSGTLVSPDGLILTNQHVVDFDAVQAELQAMQEQQSDEMANIQVELDTEAVVVLVSDGKAPPRPTYTARVERVDLQLDLAVLRISGNEAGQPFGSDRPDLPFVPIGDSGGLGLGDPIQIFGYPAIGGGALIFTTGVVSGFLTEVGIDGAAWITTDAVVSGGSSGGTAINAAGELVGVPTWGPSLDCRPGDVNGDGSVDARRQ